MSFESQPLDALPLDLKEGMNHETPSPSTEPIQAKENQSIEELIPLPSPKVDETTASLSPKNERSPQYRGLKIDILDENGSSRKVSERQSPRHVLDPLPNPMPDPGSPASNALEKASIANVEAKLKDKRVRIGSKKIGRKKYKKGKRKKLAKQPEGVVITTEHEQYALTYGMMLGILNSAGAQNRHRRNLCMDDFMKVEKKEFPPSHRLKHTFKFKDYSPSVFQQIRNRFNIDNADYMLTLCGDFNYIEFIPNSKSGQFFFYSHDGRFMIKTQTKSESKFLRRMLPHYYKFVMENPNTLITRFYGMHRVKMQHLRRKMRFVIMASVFDTPKEIHHRFDIKGSLVGRAASLKEREENGVLKDGDVIKDKIQINLGIETRKLLLEQLRKDVGFLKAMKIMDYSLLVGMHDGSKKHVNFVKTRSVTLSDCKSKFEELNSGALEGIDGPFGLDQINLSPDSPRQYYYTDGENGEERKFENDSSVFSDGDFGNLNDGDDDSFDDDDDDSIQIDPLSPRLLDVEKYPGAESIFTKDEGGVYGMTPNNEKSHMVYFLGVIDILQQYNGRKIAETFFKGLMHNRKEISAVNPDFYGDRFIDFLEENLFKI